MNATVAINSFARRHSVISPYTHFNGTEDELVWLTSDALKRDCYEIGYRNGVLLVNVPPDGFFTGLVVLQSGDGLKGSFVSRRSGEAPRQSIYVDRDHDGGKQPAKSVQIVLYGHDVLGEDNDAEHNTDYEIISINGYPTKKPAPIDPNTLMHNHFKSDGGTATLMTPSQFEQALEVSFKYWSDKALLKPQDL